ncbi:hypothetical protein BJX99DRAFT_247358 [Aspergillus californicus]
MEHFKDSNLQRPDEFNFALDVVDTWAAKSPPLEAMFWISSNGAIHQSLSYRHFSQQSHRIAILLDQLGARPGDTMMMVLPRHPACCVVIAPATVQLAAVDIQYRCQRSKATVFIGDAISVAKVIQIRHECPSLRVIVQVDGKPEKGVTNLYDALRTIPHGAKYPSTRFPWASPALLYFTSGTSGLPKMVRHNQVSYSLAHAITGKYWLNLSPGDLCWNYTEQGWGKTAYSYCGAWNCGASLFIWDDCRSFDPTSLLTLLHRFPVTTLCVPPLAWRQLVSPRCQEYYREPGEVLDEAVIKQWCGLTGLMIREGYGQTEAILLCGNYCGLPIKPGSMGKPFPGVPLHVIQPGGEMALVDEEGELALLLSDGGHPSKFFVSNVNGKLQHWYMTGDRATRDKDGYLWFVGRADEVINSSGYRIGPFEVESTMRRHPAVAECAVISSPDKTRGEVMKAIIVLAPEYSSAPANGLVKELQDFCRAISAPYKYPRKIDFVRPETLPRTISGKIKRAELRKMEWRDAKATVAHKL